MATANISRRGSLLIVVAGLAAILATLALAFTVRVRADSDASEQIMRTAQARMLLHSAMAGALKSYNNSVAIPVGTVFSVRDNSNAATWNTAWIKFETWDPADPTVGTGGVLVVVGAGPSAGVTSGSDLPYLRAIEPRFAYRFYFGGTPPNAYVNCIPLNGSAGSRPGNLP